MARGALAKDLGGDNTALGLVTFAFGAVSLVSTPIGGVMADRLPKRNLMVVSTLLLTLSSGGLAATELAGITQFWMLIVVSAVQALAFSLLVPARMAFTVDLVGPKLIPNAIALAQISMNSNRVIGPAVAGVFLGVAWLSYAAVYLFGAAASLLAVGCFLLLGPGDPDPDRPKRAPVADLLDGLRYAKGNPSVRLVLILAILVTMVAFPYVTFLPSVAADFYDAGPSGFAILTLVGAVGGLAAGLVVARTVMARGPLLQLLAGVSFGVGLIGLGLAPTFALSMVASFVVGLSTSAFQSMNATLALGLSEPAYHGRMQSLLQLGFSAFGLFSLVLGLLADAVGLRSTLVGMGISAIIVVAMGELAWRRVRQAEPLAV